MKHNKRLFGLSRSLLPLLAVGMVVGLTVDSEHILPAVRNALFMCGQSVIPSLFPFFVLTALLTGSGAAERLAACLRPVMRSLFDIDGAGALALVIGLISGYPMGANTIAALYRESKINRHEAERLLAFCNNSGPLFIIGAIGTGMLGNRRVGLYLYVIHAACALLVGLFSRLGLSRQQTKSTAGGLILMQQQQAASALFSVSVTTAVEKMLTVCGYVVFFAAVTACSAPLLNRFLPPVAALIVNGLIEVTGGAFAATQAGLSERMLLTLLSFLLGTGGLCVLLQVAGLLSGSGLSLQRYILGKLFHGALAAALTYGLYPLVKSRIVPAFAPHRQPFGAAPRGLFLQPTNLCFVGITAIFLYITFKNHRNDLKK